MRKCNLVHEMVHALQFEFPCLSAFSIRKFRIPPAPSLASDSATSFLIRPRLLNPLRTKIEVLP
jgi:hypothetical protein